MLNALLKILYFYNILHKYEYITFSIIKIFNININLYYIIKKFFIKKIRIISSLIIDNNLIKNNLITYKHFIYKKRIFFPVNDLPQHSFFYIYSINKDYSIKSLINLLTKNGKKFSSYKIMSNLFTFIKKLVGINPIFLLKKQLYKNRFLFDMQQLKLRKKTVVIPKLLSLKSQLIKSIRYLFNNFILNNVKLIGKSEKVFFKYQKLSYIILNNLFNDDMLKNLICKESSIVKNNFYHIRKENFLKKYLNAMDNDQILKKHSLFNKKYKSFTKKDKYLKYKQNQFFSFKHYLDEKKLFLFDRFQLNLQSKLKLRSK